MLEKGHHYVDIALDEVVFFIRPDHLVPMSKGGSCVEKVDFDHLGLLGFVEKEGSYELYDDDGYSRIMNRLPTIRRLLWTQREG